MPYPKQTWENFPAGGTALGKARLDHIETWLHEAIRLHEIGLGAADVAAVNSGQATTNTAWSDLLTVGPQVTVELESNVAVVRAIVFLSAQLRTDFSTGLEMGVEIDGPTQREPEQDKALRFRPHAAGSEGYIQSSIMLPAFALQPGTYTFTAKYRSTEGLHGIINARRMLVIPLPV